MSEEYRIEHDTMGEVRVPKDALYAAQTQRAVENFPISGRTLSSHHIAALGQIKRAAAIANAELGLSIPKPAMPLLKARKKLSLVNMMTSSRLMFSKLVLGHPRI